MKAEVAEMTIEDYGDVLALWRACEGVGLSEADSESSIARFLQRNPGLSYVARDGELAVGAVLCGQDGRRGYIHHLSVRESHRRRGLGRALVIHCLSALESIGIAKCHIFVFDDNQEAIPFWKGIGWTQRDELVMMSRYTTSAALTRRQAGGPLKCAFDSEKQPGNPTFLLRNWFLL